MQSRAFPLYRHVDVLVVGASSAAVSAALELRAAGKSVLVASDRSYFGEETAGRLILDDAGLDRSDALVRTVFPESGRRRNPGAIKRSLETALLEAGVAFLYYVRPVALLEDDEGIVAGALIGHRTSPFVVTCGAIVDASSQGVVARLAAVPLSNTRAWPEAIDWRIICREEPSRWSDRLSPAGEAFAPRDAKDGGPCPFFRLQVPVPGNLANPASWTHFVRASHVDGALDLCSDMLDLPPREILPHAKGLADRFEALEPDDFQPRPGLFVAGAILPLSLPAALSLGRLDVSAALGRHVAALVLKGPAGGAVASQRKLRAVTGGDRSGNYHFAEAFLRKSEGMAEIRDLVFPSLGKVDVAVVGGGTGGVGAGVSASRAGAKTVVIEIQHGLGGVGTLGLIATYWFGNRVGYTDELREQMLAYDPSHNGGHWYPEVKLGLHHKLLHEAGGEAWLGSFAFGARKREDAVDGLLVSTPFGCGLLETGCVVDATGSADVAAAAGAPCRVISGEHAAVQGTGLSPRNPGVRTANSDHTFVDDNDCEGVTHAFVNARSKFPDSFDTSPLVDTRERRQIIGEIELSPLDLLAVRTFPDTMVTAKSNFDTHGFTVHPVFAVMPPDKKPLFAHVPFRCMLPRGVDNVLVTGLGMSAHRDALPVIRMQADVQNQGYAAGLAAATAARSSGGLRGLDIKALQARLVEKGVLDPEVAQHEDSFPLDEQTVEAAVRGELNDSTSVAVVFAQRDKSIPILLERLNHETDLGKRLDVALILGMLGRVEAAPVLVEAVRSTPWDEGWNYTGMGQFGASQSRLDSLIMALATTGADETGAVLAEKISSLGSDAEFSHCRAIALAAMRAPSRQLTEALRGLLQKPGMTGHAQLDSLAVARAANNDWVETEARNLSLREIYLARALYWSGDLNDAGRKILETYTADLRGVFARHARAVLASELKAVAELQPL